jgi:hypothetical protein
MSGSAVRQRFAEPFSNRSMKRFVNRTGSDGDSGYWIPTRSWSVRFVA